MDWAEESEHPDTLASPGRKHALPASYLPPSRECRPQSSLNFSVILSLWSKQSVALTPKLLQDVSNGHRLDAVPFTSANTAGRCHPSPTNATSRHCMCPPRSTRSFGHHYSRTDHFLSPLCHFSGRIFQVQFPNRKSQALSYLTALTSSGARSCVWDPWGREDLPGW